MPGKRIFIAIDISESARAACSDHTELLRRDFPQVRVGWERTEKLHLTLKFLGSTSELLLKDLQTALSDIACRLSSFKLRLSRPGVFPSRSRPRILWIGLKDATGSLASIHREIDESCSQLGFEKEAKRFHPHITTARIRDPQSSVELADHHLQTGIPDIEFEVSEIVIYESKLGSTGSVYSRISSHEFGG
jgi:RNA 2',3'-cyclic 3'-phosphodiesterase